MPKKQGRQHRHLPAFVLLVLAERPVHGAAVHDQLLARIPGFKSDTGAVYRTLQALEAEGHVEARWDTTGSGPARKVYSLTPTGWDRLKGWRDDVVYRIDILRKFLDAYDEIAREHPEMNAPVRAERDG